MFDHAVYDTTTLMHEAGDALARRDATRLERLLQISANWLQSEAEAMAQEKMLRAMLEAAYLLDGEPSELAD